MIKMGLGQQLPWKAIDQVYSIALGGLILITDISLDIYKYNTGKEGLYLKPDYKYICGITEWTHNSHVIMIN